MSAREPGAGPEGGAAEGEPGVPPRAPGLGGLLDRLPRPLRWLTPLAALAVIAGGIYLLSRPGSAVTPPESDAAFSVDGDVGPRDRRGPVKGDPAPDFLLPVLDGAPVRLSDLRGKPVLVNFWATWCEPCKREMPAVDEVYQDAGGRLAVVAVNVEGRGAATNERLAREFRDEYGFSFPILLDTPTGDVMNQYRLKGLPGSFLIDRDGAIREIVIGTITKEKLAEKVKPLLGE